MHVGNFSDRRGLLLARHPGTWLRDTVRSQAIQVALIGGFLVDLESAGGTDGFRMNDWLSVISWFIKGLLAFHQRWLSSRSIGRLLATQAFENAHQ
ncbi:hypothetical protein [Pseudomonas oryzihabitans]|uniref:hypothetical protein n=1 Tax=Pseudomonas oryzihabitans TaxID=47885 RepID=UPI002F968136